MSARLLALAVLHAALDDIERAHLLPDIARALDSDIDERERGALERQRAQIIRDVRSAIAFVRSDDVSAWCNLAEIDAARYRERARLAARESLRHLQHTHITAYRGRYAETDSHTNDTGDTDTRTATTTTDQTA